jgi:poly(A) polymerase
VLSQWNSRLAAGQHRMPALEAAIDQVLESQTEKLAIQRRFTSDMREIWTLQPRFERRTGQAPLRLLEHLRLRAGYDFLLIRCAAEEAPAELGEWWTRFLHGTDEERAALMQEAGKAHTGASPRRRRRPRRRPAEAA